MASIIFMQVIVSTNLDGFSLVNHGQFAKFTESPPAKLSCYTASISNIETTVVLLSQTVTMLDLQNG